MLGILLNLLAQCAGVSGAAYMATANLTKTSRNWSWNVPPENSRADVKKGGDRFCSRVLAGPVLSAVGHWNCNRGKGCW